MAITERDEERAANSRKRQLQPPLLIRDDGMLYPHTKLTAKNPRFRPYHASPSASLEDRMRYLQGLGAKRAVTYTVEEEPFDIGKADAEALVQFAQEQFGMVLDPNKPIKTLREHVFNLSQLPDPGNGSSTAESLSDVAASVAPAVIDAAALANVPARTLGGRQPRKAA
jgi:hypothetical protein